MTSPLNIVVTGASGLLGRAVVQECTKRGHNVQGLAYSRTGPNLKKLDLNDAEATKALFGEIKPQVVVHCAAERRPDVAEKNPEATRELNIQVPRMLSNLSKEQGFFLIYMSTDYVFDGNAPPSGYEPDDKTHPLNLYGETKLDGEKEVINGINSGAKGTLLRVPVLYGDAVSNDESAVNVLMNAARNTSKEAKMDDWSTRFPTNVSDVARVLVDVSELSQSKQIPPRLHFSSQKLYSKYKIAQLFADLTGTSKKHLIQQSEGPGPNDTVRPRDTHLSNAVLEKLGVNCSTVSFEEWWQQYLAQGGGQK